MGGLNINTKAQVVSSQTAMPIPNLYASGENVGSVHEPSV
ncbi:FAD-binding protein [Campylobacter concisus]|nr:FAD-binding protein [Campylobacter concisus]